MEKKTPRLSPSLAKILLNESPYHAWSKHYLLGGGDHEEEHTDSKDNGKLVDKLVFGVGPDILIRQPRKRVTVLNGELVCTAEDLARAKEQADSVKLFLELRGIKLDKANAQPKWYWTTNGGVQCSGRPDCWDPNGIVYDLKTAKSLSDKSIEYQYRDYGWGFQVGAYLEAASAIHSCRNPQFKFIVVESKRPYSVRLVTLDSVKVGEATFEWLSACALWKHCLETDTWPMRDDLEMKGRGDYSKRDIDAGLNYVTKSMKGETD